MAAPDLTPVKVWDLPIRLFHWSLVSLIVLQWATAEDDVAYNMTWHMYGGYAILCLIAFRLLWGIVGSHHARFHTFIYSPKTTVSYFKTLFKREEGHYLGHNPLGAYSVFALLLLVFIQAVTGLFADDEIFTTGPFASWVSGDTSELMTKLHHLNFDILMIFVGLHLAAIAFYAVFKRDNLARAMVTGKKWVKEEVTSPNHAPLWLALLIFVVASSAVLALVLWLPTTR